MLRTSADLNVLPAEAFMSTEALAKVEAKAGPRYAAGACGGPQRSVTRMAHYYLLEIFNTF